MKCKIYTHKHTLLKRAKPDVGVNNGLDADISEWEKYSSEKSISEDLRWVVPQELEHEFLRVEVMPAPSLETSMEPGQQQILKDEWLNKNKERESQRCADISMNQDKWERNGDMKTNGEGIKLEYLKILLNYKQILIYSF